MAYARKLLSNTNVNSTSPPSSRPAVVASPPEAVAMESNFAVILAALLCALISVAGLIAVARCSWLRRGHASGGAGGGNGSRLANKGLKKKVLESLPKYIYKNENNMVVVGEDCAICLAEYANGDEVRVLPQCGHRFHVECIDKWFGSHSSCPSCRTILVVVRCKKRGERPVGGSATEGGGNGFVKASQVSSSDLVPSSSPTFGL